MATLAAVDLLEGWEKGRAASQVAGSVLALLAAANPAKPWKELARMSIGERDSLLLELREVVFGPKLQGLVSCPECKETLEVNLGLADLRVASQKMPADKAAAEVFALQAGDYTLQFRLPNSLDLMALGAGEDVEEGRLMLLERVILSAVRGEETIAAQEIPESVLMLAEKRMEEADPQADVTLRVACKACGYRCETLFDIASFVWKEVDAWAIRLLREIHALASAYGWREADIIAMSQWRRSCYMEMLGA